MESSGTVVDLKYFQVCSNHMLVFQKALASIEVKAERIENLDDHTLERELYSDYFESTDALEESGMITVVFAAMCLEASLNQFGAFNLGHDYFNDHLDRLRPTSKLTILTRLVLSQDYPTDASDFVLFRQLFSDRNAYVHFKSKRVQGRDVQTEQEWIMAFREEVENAMRAVLQVSARINRMCRDFRQKYPESSVSPLGGFPLNLDRDKHLQKYA